MIKIKILICDDDEGIIDVLGLILEDTGHFIISETNSLKVKSILDLEKPDLVILDLWMPVLSGDQILRMIRASSEYNHLPIISISASRDGKEIAMDAGAATFIAKPFDMENIINTIQHIL